MQRPVPALLLTLCLALILAACGLQPPTAALLPSPSLPATRPPATSYASATPASALPSRTPAWQRGDTPTFTFNKLDQVETDLPYCRQGSAGSAQSMDVYYPSSNGPWPVLIYLHGGRWSEGDKLDGEAWHFVTGGGILFVSLNYRLADGKVQFPAMIEDVKCAVRHLRANAAGYNLDPERIAVIGWSAGGHLAALLGTSDPSAGWDVGAYPEQSSRVQAVVTVSGLSDLTRPMYQPIAEAVEYAFGVTGGTASPVLTDASPVTYISADDPPFFIVHGNQDQIVNFDQSDQLHVRLRAAGVPSTFLVVEHAYHSLRGATPSLSRFEIQMQIYAFLVSELQP